MHEIRNVLNFPAADMACSTLDKLKKLKTRFGGHHRAFTATRCHASSIVGKVPVIIASLIWIFDPSTPFLSSRGVFLDCCREGLDNVINNFYCAHFTLGKEIASGTISTNIEIIRQTFPWKIMKSKKRIWWWTLSKRRFFNTAIRNAFCPVANTASGARMVWAICSTVELYLS